MCVKPQYAQIRWSTDGSHGVCMNLHLFEADLPQPAEHLGWVVVDERTQTVIYDCPSKEAGIAFLDGKWHGPI